MAAPGARFKSLWNLACYSRDNNGNGENRKVKKRLSKLLTESFVLIFANRRAVSRRISPIAATRANDNSFVFFNFYLNKKMNFRFCLVILFGIIVIVSSENTTCPTIINRSAWNAENAKAVAYLITPLPHAVIHHTVTPQCTTLEVCSARVKNIQEFHMNELGFDDIGFSFFIGGDGNVYEGVGWTKEGAHTYRWNKKAAGIAFIGNFGAHEPSQKMLEAARKLIDCGKAQGYLRRDVKVIGARQVSSTISPGDRLSEKIREWPEWTALP